MMSKPPDPPLNDEIMRQPTFPPKVEKLCWLVFAVNTATVIASLVAQTFEASSIGTDAKGWIMIVTRFVFPSLLIVVLVGAAVNTYYASNGFGKRLAGMSERIRYALEHCDADGDQMRQGGAGFTIIRRPDGMRTTGAHSLDDFAIKCTVPELQPTIFRMVKSPGIVWTLRRYLELLTEEQKRARVTAGKLAGCLGASFATGMLAFYRIVQHFS